MFYRPADGHGLPHNPFTAIVAPRPIAWISSRGARGDNLAPYSFFNAVGYNPPQIMFASTGIKDTLTNIRETGVFAVNIVSAALFHAMSATSATLPHGTDEFTIAGLERTDCALIPCPRVVGAPATLECEVVQEIALRGQDNIMTIGEVIGVHLRDDCLMDGRFDITRYQPMARAGYQDYARVDRLITLARPDET
jgi:flavin reductase (DIM6/NTAB) family NADH-FMN oxidoreductase RutF